MYSRSRSAGRLFAALVALVVCIGMMPVSAGADVAGPPVAIPDGVGSSAQVLFAVHPSAAANDRFGDSAAVGGDWAVIGSPGLSTGGLTDCGRATAYHWTPSGGWRFAGDLPVPARYTYQYLGWATAISGDELFVRGRALVGSVIDAVYVYDVSSGTPSLVQTITIPGSFQSWGVGRALAVDDDTLVISAPSVSVGATECGSVYVFTKGVTGWAQIQQLQPPAAALDTSGVAQMFGEAVAIQGDDLVVGAPQWGLNNEGRVYNFRRDPFGTWIYFGDQTLPTHGPNDMFGKSVAVSNGVMAAGAPGCTTVSGAGAGVTYVSRWTSGGAGEGWHQIADLKSPTLALAGEGFGRAVVMSADDLLVKSDNGPGAHQTVYHYTIDRTSPIEPAYVNVAANSAPSGGSPYGICLAFDGDTLVEGGSSYSPPSFASAGAAWFYAGLRTARVQTNGSLSVPMMGVLGNDYLGGASVTASLAAAPSHGTAAVNADGSYTYTPAKWFYGTDTFRYRATSSSGSNVSTVTVSVFPFETKVATALNIASTSYSTLRSRTFNLTGVLRPGRYQDLCVVWVRKPGRTYWSYSSARLAYSANPDGSANWWYRYNPRTIPRGIYAFKVSFAGDANRLASSSSVISVRVR
jgi:hypothetical protein